MCEGLMSNRARLNKGEAPNTKKPHFLYSQMEFDERLQRCPPSGGGCLLPLRPSARLDQKASDQLPSHCHICFDPAIFTLSRTAFLNNSERLLIWPWEGPFPPLPLAFSVFLFSSGSPKPQVERHTNEPNPALFTPLLRLSAWVIS